MKFSDVTITHAHLMLSRARLAGAHAPENARISVTLNRLRQRLELEAPNVIAEWTAIDQRYAQRDTDDTPMLRRNDQGQTATWSDIGVPAYVPDEARLEERLKAFIAFDAELITIAVPLLAEADLDFIRAPHPHAGVTLDLFVRPEES